ncbi:MaoC/PaaZ C-terminal domain-containing protein [Streptomyces sp. NBC_00009]|uniref:MaoC/PaaZ C-terminal domain-containing protein n=1 Tax=Streptomyces sp. NBC_00009 TaxID=2975620 RepID=UPI00324B630D
MVDASTGIGAGVGAKLAPLEIPVTRTLIVSGAIASRDYQDVHHDAELAKEKGSPDIFMNILTTNGLVGRYITDHFGPTAVLRKVAIRLGAPNYPGDTMVLTGTVIEAEAEAEDGDGSGGESAGRGATVVVRIAGANGLGTHVTGTVTVTLPSLASPVNPTSTPSRPSVSGRPA